MAGQEFTVAQNIRRTPPLRTANTVIIQIRFGGVTQHSILNTGLIIKGGY